MMISYCKRYLSNILVLTVFCSSVAHGQTIIISPNHYQIDKTLKLIVCNQVSVSVPSSATSIQLDNLYTFTSAINSISTDQFYPVTFNNTTYQLSFTRFPIISIDTKGTLITQDIVTKGSIRLADTTGAASKSPIGVSIRGAYSATFPKKSYKVIFYTDTVSQTAKDTALFGLRTDSDWILLALYNESLRINNITSYALWRNMHQLYYINQEATALSAIRTKYVDVFINGSYAGIYALGEQIDRKQLQLKKTKDNGSVRGELYKSFDWTTATTLTGMPAKNGNDITWAGFELKYPNQSGFWTNLYGLVDSTVNWSNSRFSSQIATKWQIDNLVDYFLFLNLVRATDNGGKNLYIARYKENEPYFIIPWDLDGTWGSIWTGGHENITNDILSYGLYDRLLSLNPANFKQKLKTRWFGLRANFFSTANLKSGLATNASLLTNNGSYLREALTWPVADVNAEITYMNTWIDNRTAFLDNYFSQFPDPCTNPEAPTISASTSTSTAGQRATLIATGCSYTVIWNTGETGDNLIVSPQNTTSYWAICNQVAAGCQSPTSLTITLTVNPGTDPNAPQADLSLNLISSQHIVPVNTTTRMTLMLKNNGPATSRTIRLQNRLPTGLKFDGSVSAAVKELNGVINISLDSLATGQTVEFSYYVFPISEGAYRNTAQVLMSSTYDPDSYPGSGTGDGQDDMAVVDIRTLNATSTIISESPNPNQQSLPALLSNQPTPDPLSADLSLALKINKRAINQGTFSTITMSIFNYGGLDAAGILVQCILPVGVQFVSGNNVSADGNTVSATGLSVTSGSITSVDFQVKSINTGTMICQGQIMQSSQPDPDSTPGNGTTNGEDDTSCLDWRVGL